MTTFKSQGLSSSAVEVLMQMFVKGPVWDGNVSSKNGRGELLRAGLAFHHEGWTSLTPEGVSVAIGWDRADLKTWHDQRWYEKLRDA